MYGITSQNAWYKPLLLPQAPSAPDIFRMTQAVGQQPAPNNEAAPAADSGTETEASGKTSNSIGQSPVVQAFLLRLQELGLSLLPGTDGDDVINGWSKTLADTGDGNDTINVWSGSVVDAGAGDDVIKAWSDSVVYAGAGNDQVDAWSGSVVDAGDGDDIVKAWSDTTVLGGAGNDVISAWSNSKVNGGDGDDVISVWSDSVAEGGAGNDSIYAHSNALVSGGAGDDMISVGADSVVTFARGDGHDTIYADRNTTVKFGDGISADKTQVSVSGNVATITFAGSDDAITLHLGPRGPATLAFADGTAMSIEAGPRPAVG